MSLTKKQKKERALKQGNRAISVLQTTKHLWQNESILPCVDIETFEFAQNQVLEVGVSYIDIKQLTVTHTDHYIVEQYKNRRNGKYVKDNKDNFDFGVSQTKHLNKIAIDLSETFRKMSAISALGTKTDCGYLIDSGVIVPNKRINVHTLYEVAYQHRKGHQVSLKTLSEQFGHALDHPHNAGNDAHVTALCLVDILKHVQDNYDTLLQLATEHLEKLNESVHN